MSLPTPQDRKLEEPVVDARIRVVEQFVAGIAPGIEERSLLYINLVGRLVIHTAVLQLWKAYKEGPKAEALGFEPVQLDLIFHNHDACLQPLTEIRDILTLMATGKPNGVVDRTKDVNFFPAGFWNMPDIATVLIDALGEQLYSLVTAVCSLHFCQPEGWETDESVPEGLYQSLDDQAEDLWKRILAEHAWILRKPASSEADTADSTSEPDEPSSSGSEDDEEETAVDPSSNTD
jgi:hypothetical protein